MIPELWLIVSTVCFSAGWSGGGCPYLWEHSTFFADAVLVSSPTACIRKVVDISTTQPAAKSGETVYRVIPATATACDVWGHDWYPLSFEWRGCTGMICERCWKCRKKEEFK